MSSEIRYRLLTAGELTRGKDQMLAEDCERWRPLTASEIDSEFSPEIYNPVRRRLPKVEVDPTELPVDHPDYVPGCDISGKCQVSEEDEASGETEAMCVLCGGTRYRYPGNWGTRD
ncbi:hypothetical protein [Salipiger sp. PrR003]|uniref:hypothetical protein n=1 Tax=Salipiger sp. PrR003 TaxID=2706776 RepID=UPI0013D8FE0A|nr:hypothetical protein [Salipiger sp. PrR003]NDV50154.1 hypothetical protein [Salipiger sp. PrR003]